MWLRTSVKKAIGRALPVDFCERLTEYSIWQRVEGFDLAGAREVRGSGEGWAQLVDGGRRLMWRSLVDELEGRDVLFLEFGVWKGDSIRCFSEMIRSPASLFYGFDSFEGLPEAWRGRDAGEFSTHGQPPTISDERVKFMKGWFQDTLPQCIELIGSLAARRTVLVHFDADLYSSTLFLLYTLAQKLNEFHFIFDEFSGHESRALYNFRQASNADVIFDAYTTWRGCPSAVGGRLRLPTANSARGRTISR